MLEFTANWDKRNWDKWYHSINKLHNMKMRNPCYEVPLDTYSISPLCTIDSLSQEYVNESKRDV